MNKDNILEAANAMQNGEDSNKYYDELEVIIGLIMKATEDEIAAIVQEIHEDDIAADPQN